MTSPDAEALAALDPDVLGAAIYDTDGTFLSVLPLASGLQFQVEISAPGALSIQLPLDDAATSLCTARRIFKVFWRGKARQAAEIDSSSTDLAVDGQVWRVWSNLPGMLDIFGRVLVYPEYGLDRTTSSTRTFGYMSRTGHGDWLGTGDWTPAIGVRWSDMTGPRYDVHVGAWSSPNPKWIAKNGPDADEPAGSLQFFRRRFTTATKKQVQILASGDNYVDLWLDGEQIINSSGQNQFTWQNVYQTLTTLQAGLHVIAARVRNNKDAPSGAPNHMAFIFTMQEVDANGKPLDQPPLVNSDEEWLVSSTVPAFRRAEVIYRMFGEGSAYGYTVCDRLPLDFTRTTDSDGNAFTDTPGEYTIDANQSYLDVFGMLTEKDLDVGIDPETLKFQAWNRLGADKTATVQLRLGTDGGNLLAHPVNRTEPTVNTIVFQLADGRWEQRQNAAAVTANGREGAGLSMGSTSDQRTANQTADAQLDQSSRGTVTFGARISSADGPQVFIDCDLGDTITVPNENGTGGYAGRLMAITVDGSKDGLPQTTLELMLDRSATPASYDSTGPGVTDPGDLEDPTSPGDIGSGGSTGGSATYSTLAWEETFSGSSIDTASWNVRDEAEAGTRLGYYRPANVTVQSDGLHITAQVESYGGKDYTTGYVDTIGHHSWSVGRWEFDAMLPGYDSGLWPALWLRCDSTAGEIDVLETVGGLPDMVVQTVHENTDGSQDRSGFEWHGGSDFYPTDLHTYALERDADGTLRWYIDDVLTRTRTPSDTDNQHNTMGWLNGPTFASPLNIRINLQVGGAMPTYYGKSVDPSFLPDDMVIQAVRVYV